MTDLEKSGLEGEAFSPKPLRDRFFQGIRDSNLDAVRAALAEDRTLVTAFDPDHFGANPVTVAVHNGNLELVDLLLEHGADINRKSDWWAGGFAPIHSIPRHHREWLLPALLERGATMDVHAAAQHGDVERLEALIDEDPGRVLERGGDGQHPLHFAETVDVATHLLAKGADLEARCIDHHSTPAQWAACDRPYVCRFLIERGAAQDVWMLAAIGWTEKLEARLEDEPELVHGRLTTDFQRGPNPEVLNIYHFTIGTDTTLLHAAAGRGFDETVRMLIARGADANATGGYDDATPLHLAAWNDRVSAAEALLEGGADIDRRSGEIHENEPMGWAVVSGKTGMIEFLLSRGATAQPSHIEDAEYGIGGGFKAYTGATAEDFRAIVEMLQAASR